MADDYLKQLSDSVGEQWPHITEAAQAADEKRTELSELLAPGGSRMTSSDADIVVFGSLARGEWTSTSDVDWTLLVDGQADPEHRKVAQGVERRLLEAQFKEPGPTGTFGSLAFSHDIVHLIGGQADSNINTTRRVLLLLESARVEQVPQTNGGSPTAYERVLRNVLHRYLLDDTNLFSKEGPESKVPRFLLNDIVRFWRTMCVDFAWKGWERGQKGWALRNIKLRMSRKLIFVSGLLMCASGYLDANVKLAQAKIDDDDNPVERLLDQLLGIVHMPALQIVSHALLKYADKTTSTKLLEAYNSFLGTLNNDEERKHLDELDPAKAYDDELFKSCRDGSHRFQEALTSLFFEDNEQLKKFTITYGVF